MGWGRALLPHVERNVRNDMPTGWSGVSLSVVPERDSRGVKSSAYMVICVDNSTGSKQGVGMGQTETNAKLRSSSYRPHARGREPQKTSGQGRHRVPPARAREYVSGPKFGHFRPLSATKSMVPPARARGCQRMPGRGVRDPDAWSRMPWGNGGDDAGGRILPDISPHVGLSWGSFRRRGRPFV